jgi:hypothetical protein
LVVGWKVVGKLEAGKNLVFVLKVDVAEEVEPVQRFSTAGVSAVRVSRDWVLRRAEVEVAVLEQLAAGKSLVLVVEVVVELVQRSWSAEAAAMIISMDWVLPFLLNLDSTVGMARQEVVTVGTSSKFESPSLDFDLHPHLHPHLHLHLQLQLQLQHIPFYSLPLDLDPSTSSSQQCQPVANFPLRYLYTPDSESLPQRAWPLLHASGRDRVRLSPPRICLGLGDGDIPCRSGGRRCSGWRI